MNKKTIVICVVVVLLIIICIGVVVYFFHEKVNNEVAPVAVNLKEKVDFEYSNLVFEYYEKAKYEDNIFNEYIEVTSGYFDTTELGTFVAKVECDYNEVLGFIDVEYQVVDTTSPIIMSGTSYTVYVGEEFDYESKFIVADNYDKKADCNIIGDYDLDKIGKYFVTFEAMDSSNNMTSKDIYINVIEKPVETNTNTSTSATVSKTKIYLDDIIEEHKDENTKIGIDVSKWQGNIDWDKVKDAGVEFAIIRLGYEGSTTGNTIIDEKFEYNLENAKRVGIDVGIYIYTMSSTLEKAEAQANEIVELLDGVELELPIVFDWEEWGKFNSYNISLQDLNNMADVFIQTVESHGYDGMNYGSANYLRTMFKNDKRTWLAHYTDMTTYEGNYCMWQLTDSGVVDGINGDVDLNILYTDRY